MSAKRPHKKRRTATHIHDDPDKQHDPVSPALTTELHIPQAAIDAYNADSKRNYHLEKWKFRLEILGFLAVVTYSVIAYKQWISMREATNAATKSANIAEQTLVLSQRPWVAVTNVQLFSAFELGKTNKIAFTFENSGPTPSLNTIATFNTIDDTPDLPDFWPVFPGVGIIPRTVIPHGTKPVATIDIPARKDFSKTFHILGRIDYQDVLYKWHWTKFCYVLPNANSTELVLCPNNNEMGETEDQQGQSKPSGQPYR